MRLIDADALYDKIENKYKFSNGEAHKAFGEVLDELVILDTLGEVPVFPVKTGQTVYRVAPIFFGYAMVLDSTVVSITVLTDGKWIARDYAMNIIATSETWQKDVFDTREAAQKRLKEIVEGDKK